MQCFRVLPVVLVLQLVFGAASAAASVDSDELISKGVELRRQLRDQDALAMFQKAVALDATPRGYAQLALCEHALGLWVAAEQHLQEALRHASDPWIRKNETTLRADLGKVGERLGSIDLWGSPAGARVTLPGQPAVTLPLAHPLRAPEGRQNLTITASGYLPQTRSIEVHAGELAREHIELEAIAPRPVPTATEEPPPKVLVGPTTAATVTGKTGASEAGEDGGASPESSSGGITRRWWFWAIVGTVAVAGGTTAYLLTRGGSSCPPGSCGTW